jgi:hypothetical protein
LDKQEIAEAYRIMMVTAGWQLLEKYVRERAQDERNQLMHCKNWEEVLEHRHRAEGLEMVLSHVEHTIREAREGVEERDGEVS